MLTRSYDRQGRFDLYTVDEPAHLVCFVHGFGGASSPSYWGLLHKNARLDDRLHAYDLAFWGYWTHKFPWPRVLAVLARRNLPSPPTAADALVDELSAFAMGRYQSITVVGHSLGGIVAYLAYANIKGVVDRVAAIAAPQSVPRGAAILNAVYFNTNVQLSFLAKPDCLSSARVAFARQAVARGMRPFHMVAAQDEILTGENFPEGETVTIMGVHSWMAKESGINNASYELLAAWLLREGCP